MHQLGVSLLEAPGWPAYLTVYTVQWDRLMLTACLAISALLVGLTLELASMSLEEGWSNGGARGGTLALGTRRDTNWKGQAQSSDELARGAAHAFVQAFTSAVTAAMGGDGASRGA